MSRVLVVGLDALDPDLVDRWLPLLPNLRRLSEAGISGPLQSVVQPVTPAAWSAMVTGRNQGRFGCPHDYDAFKAQGEYTLAYDYSDERGRV